MNTAELKQRAIILEQELEKMASQSSEIAAFAAHEPLINAIKRAKASEISLPEEIPGIQHWMFETNIFWEHQLLGEIFSRFHLLLSGLED